MRGGWNILTTSCILYYYCLSLVVYADSGVVNNEDVLSTDFDNIPHTAAAEQLCLLRSEESSSSSGSSNSSSCRVVVNKPSDDAVDSIAVDLHTADFSPSNIFDEFGNESTWIINGDSLVEMGRSRRIINDIRILTLMKQDASKVVGQLTAGNDIVFELRSLKNEWNVTVTLKTDFKGAPDDMFFEKVVTDNFFKDGQILKFERSNDPVPSLYLQNNQNSSIQLIPIPSFFANRHSDQTIQGDWTMSYPMDDDDNRLEVMLSLTQMGSQRYTMDVKAINTHTVMVHINEEGQVSMEPVFSTRLTPDNPNLETLENQFINELSQTTLIQIKDVPSQTPPADSNVTPTLTLTGPLTTLQLTRPENSNRWDSFHIIPVSYWNWMPETRFNGTATNQSHNETYGKSTVPILLELHHSGPAIAMDIYIATETHLNVIYLPGMQNSYLGQQQEGSQSKIITIVSEHWDTQEEKEINEFMKNLFGSLDTIDINDSNNFLTIIGQTASLTFEAIPIPSEGTWLFEPSQSRINGEMISMLNETRRPTLTIAKHLGHLEAELQSQRNFLNFQIINKSHSKSTLDWRVSQLARRQTQTIDVLIEFFHDDLEILMITGSNIMGIGFFNQKGDVLFFTHPLKLIDGILGFWQLTNIKEKDASLHKMSLKAAEENQREGPEPPTVVVLRLLSNGIGEIHGRLTTGNQHYLLKLKETLDFQQKELLLANGTDSLGNTDMMIVPRRWLVDIVELPSDDHHHQKNQDAIINLLRNCTAWDIAGSEAELTLSCDQTIVHFVKSLDRRVRHHLEGRWVIELILLEETTSEVGADDISTAIHHPEVGSWILELNLLDDWTDSNALTFEDDHTIWDRRSMTAYDAKVSSFEGDQIIATFVLYVNPHGSIVAKNLKQQSLKDILIADDKVRDMAELLLRHLMSIQDDSQFMIEIFANELLMSDGGSILGLSKIPVFNATSTFTTSETPKTNLSIRTSTTPTTSTQSDQKVKKGPSVNAVEMMGRLRRRLEAAAILQDVLSPNTNS